MAQHGLKQKTQLPKGVKQKTKKGAVTKKQPRKGAHVVIPAKKNAAVEQAKTQATVTRIINDKNEQMVRNTANKAQGRVSNQK